MRTSCILITALSVAACGGGAGGGGTPGDDQPTPDAAVIPPSGRGFIITTPDITIMPGQEITYCYYFRTPNKETLAIKHWVSEMTPNTSHHMIMFTTGNQDAGPVGTYDTNCGGAAPVWTYA